MPHFFSDLPLSTLAPGATFTLPERVFRHAILARRMRTGDTLTLFDETAASLDASVSDISKKEARATAASFHPAPPKAQNSFTLALATIAADRFDWAIQKCTELGASAIAPVTTARCQPLAFSDKRALHWREVAIAACEQSQRLTLPEIPAPAPLKNLASRATGIVLDLDAKLNLLECLQATKSEVPDKELALLIGPEGGFTPDELGLLHDAGWQSARLGDNILRAETAAVAATAIAMAAQDF
jgi:16S rRNA (uracil1498-N3)-methyltransferase